jgi:outer membrane lipoprotein-sorting protein
MKRILFTLLLIGLTQLIFAQSNYDPQALETLEAMSKKYQGYSTFEASITSSMINEVENIKEEFKGKITVKGSKFRLVMEDQEIINDGTTVWT